MSILNIVVTVLLIIDSLALIVVVMMQEGKQGGLSGSIAGAGDTFWSKNKGRSKEGKLEKWSKVFLALFIILALALNIIAKHL